MPASPCRNDLETFLHTLGRMASGRRACRPNPQRYAQQGRKQQACQRVRRCFSGGFSVRRQQGRAGIDRYAARYPPRWSRRFDRSPSVRSGSRTAWRVIRTELRMVIPDHPPIRSSCRRSRAAGQPAGGRSRPVRPTGPSVRSRAAARFPVVSILLFTIGHRCYYHRNT